MSVLHSRRLTWLMPLAFAMPAPDSTQADRLMRLGATMNDAAISGSNLIRPDLLPRNHTLNKKRVTDVDPRSC